MLKKLGEQKNAKGNKRNFVTLRNPAALDLAMRNPDEFFNLYKPPLIIDEFQLAPSLSSTMRYMIDEKEDMGEDCSGMFWPTGSENYLC